MNIEKIDFFQPLLVVVAIIAFLAMGYIGSFNYRFEDPLKLEVILTIHFSCRILSVGAIAIKNKINLWFLKINYIKKDMHKAYLFIILQ